jgi:hypothetical protein
VRHGVGGHVESTIARVTVATSGGHQHGAHQRGRRWDRSNDPRQCQPPRVGGAGWPGWTGPMR